MVKLLYRVKHHAVFEEKIVNFVVDVFFYKGGYFGIAHYFLVKFVSTYFQQLSTHGYTFDLNGLSEDLFRLHRKCHQFLILFEAA